LPLVSLSVAIIVPFLIIAFTVNDMREKARNSKRKLDYRTRNITSRRKKLWFIIKQLVFLTLRLILTPFGYLLVWIIDDAWDDFTHILKLLRGWIGAAFRFLRKGILKFIGLFLCLKRKKTDDNDDPESQELDHEGVIGVDEKAVGENIEDRPIQ
jgi:hypothetical protein